MSRFIAMILSIFTVGLLISPSVGAVDLFNRCTSADTSQCKIVKENNLDYRGKNMIWTVMQFVLGLLGGIAVIMIVVGGIKFTVSNGDASAVASAKKTILYSVVGLVVALLASGIVLLVSNFFG